MYINFHENPSKNEPSYSGDGQTDRYDGTILIIKANKMHYFSTLFGKELYVFQTDLLSIIRSFNTVYTAIGICHMKILKVGKITSVYTCTGLFVSPFGISELDCATTKTDTAERSILIGREFLRVFFCTRGLGVLPGSTARG